MPIWQRWMRKSLTHEPFNLRSNMVDGVSFENRRLLPFRVKKKMTWSERKWHDQEEEEKSHSLKVWVVNSSMEEKLTSVPALGENRTSLITHQHINWASFAIIMAPMFSHCSCQHCILPSVLSVIKPKVVAMTVNRLAVSDLLPGPNLPPEPSILPKKKC